MSRSNNKAVHPSIHVADLHRASRAAFIWIALRCQLASSTALHFTRVPGVSIFTYDSAAIVSVAWWASRGFVVFGLGWVARCKRVERWSTACVCVGSWQQLRRRRRRRSFVRLFVRSLSSLSLSTFVVVVVV